MDERLGSISELRSQSRRFVSGELSFGAFKAALSWFRFDEEDEDGTWNPERAVADLPGEFQQEYMFYVRWHLAMNEERFANPSWVYGQDQKPYGWINTQAYHKAFSEEFGSLKLSAIAQDPR